MPDGEIELLFLGTGTSAGVPMIGCHCDVCRSPDPRDKRTRASVADAGSWNRFTDPPAARYTCPVNVARLANKSIWLTSASDFPAFT